MLTLMEDRVLYQLKKNARQSNRDIARTLQCSPTTVGKIIYQLEARGVITGYTAIVDEAKI